MGIGSHGYQVVRAVSLDLLLSEARGFLGQPTELEGECPACSTVPVRRRDWLRGPAGLGLTRHGALFPAIGLWPLLCRSPVSEARVVQGSCDQALQDVCHPQTGPLCRENLVLSICAFCPEPTEEPTLAALGSGTEQDQHRMEIGAWFYKALGQRRDRWHSLCEGLAMPDI